MKLISWPVVKIAANAMTPNNTVSTSSPSTVELTSRTHSRRSPNRCLILTTM